MSKRHKSKVKAGEKKLNFYYGIPHSHTSYSTGRGTPKEAAQQAKSRGLHFLFITDHNKYLQETVFCKKEKILKWDAAEKTINRFNKKNKSFLAGRGYEIKIRNIGDINILNASEHSKGSFKDLDRFISVFENQNDAVGIINHPGRSSEKLIRSQNLNKYIPLMEVGNGAFPHRYNRYIDRFFKFIDSGWKLGVVNSQDNHNYDWGKYDNLTVVLAEKLTSSELIEALRCRRTYSTESRSLKLVFKVNGHYMGDTIDSVPGMNLNFFIYAKDNEIPIDKVEIITTRGRILREIEVTSSYEVREEFSITSSMEEKWYLLRVYQQDERIAVSSPIFIENK